MHGGGDGHQRHPAQFLHAALQAGGQHILLIFAQEPFQRRDVQMDGQTHAFHLFQIRNQGIPGGIGQIDIDLIQRIPAQPLHKAVKARLDRGGADFFRRIRAGIHQSHAHNAQAPVAAQRFQKGRGALLRGDDPHQRGHAALVKLPVQIPFEPHPKRKQADQIADHHTHIEIAGLQKRCLGDQQKHRQRGGKQRIHPQAVAKLPRGAALGDVLGASGPQENQKKSKQQNQNKLQYIFFGIMKNDPQYPVQQQPGHRRTENQAEQVHRKHHGVLQFLAFFHVGSNSLYSDLSLQQRFGRIPAYILCIISRIGRIWQCRARPEPPNRRFGSEFFPVRKKSRSFWPGFQKNSCIFCSILL